MSNSIDYTISLDWHAFIRNIIIDILANGQSINSTTYHLGQKLELSFKASIGEIEDVELKNIKWSLEEPLPHKSTSNRAHILDNYSVVPLLAEDFFKNELDFYLFDFDAEKKVKLGTFTYQLGDKIFNQGFKISYFRPIVMPAYVEKPGQEINIKPTNDANVFGFGFVEEDEAGFSAYSGYKNVTDTTYDFGSIQLIKVNATRSFTDQSGALHKQVMKTDGYWLDKYAPINVYRV